MGNEGYPSADARRTRHRDSEYMAKRIPVLVTSLKDSRAIQVSFCNLFLNSVKQGGRN